MPLVPNCIQRLDLVLSDQFARLGSSVARAPTTFFLVPVLFTALFATGFQTFYYLADTEELFVPIYARALKDREVIESLFIDDYGSYVKGDTIRLPNAIDVNLIPREGISALSISLWTEAALLVQTIEQVRVRVGDREVGWTDLCAQFDGECVDNSFLSLAEGRSGELMTNLSYPVEKPNSRSDQWFALAAHMGGITVEQGRLTAARSMKLSFVLGAEEDLLSHRKMWVAGVESVLQRVRMEHATVTCYWNGIIEKELMENIHSSMEMLPITATIITTYTVLTCMSTDWVTSKPMMGVGGLITVLLATGSGFGLAMYLGFCWQAINLVAVFLLLGIGMDGVFLVLSAWARSSVHSLDVVTRVSITYSDVAVSLTVTSVTNVVGLLVGAILPGFRCVQSFCMYAALGLAFNYLWMITVFGSFLTWAGYLEQSNRHSLFWTRVVPKDEAPSFVYMTLLSGGHPHKEGAKQERKKEEKMMVFFRDIFSPFISKTSTKVAIFFTFIAYIAFAVIGILQLQEGLERKKLVQDDSTVYPYFEAEDKYFRDHPYRLQVVITEPLDYHNRTVQKQVLSLIHELEDLSYISSNTEFRQSWLHVFLDLARENFLVFNITTKTQFYTKLKMFLSEATKHPVSYDVKFSDDGTEITSSRFYLQTERIANATEEVKMMQKLREVVDLAPFHAVIYHPFFPFFDQFAHVMSETVMSCVFCICVMSLVTLILIPNRASVIWVIFTICSVNMGVLGLMSLWGVNLDVISMIVLIMGVGFSVDFSAHISYHYLSSDQSIPPSARLAGCMYALGPPVVQGAITTLLGTLPLAFQDSFIIRTFSKVIFLVIFLGMLHSLFLLPMLLTMFGPGSCQGTGTNSHHKEEHKMFSPNSLVLSDTFVYSKQNAAPGSSNKLASTGQGRLNTDRKQKDYSYRKRREAVMRRSPGSYSKVHWVGGESGNRRIPSRRMRDVLHPYRESRPKAESPSLISHKADQGRINYSFSMGDLSTSSSFNTFKIPEENTTPSVTGTGKNKFVFIDHKVQTVSKGGKLGISNNNDSSLDSFDSVDLMT